jgi:hypothetical protein
MLDFHSSAFLGIFGEGAFKLPDIFTVLALLYVILQIFERTHYFITDEAVSCELHLELLLLMLLVLSFPVLYVHSLKLCLFSSSIRVDNHQLRKRHYLYPALTLELNAEIVMICTSISSVFSVNVVAHQQSAEVRTNLAKFCFFYVLFNWLEQLSVNFLCNRSNLF